MREYGVLLPHFGRYCTTERMRAAGPLIEGLGFNSVWVRDHVVHTTHGHEDPNATFIDPFVVLAGIAHMTERLKLGSAILIPHRHPIHAAGLLGSLDFIAGPGRVIAGWGIGNWDREFEAIGLGSWDRREVLEEYVGIMRSLWSGEPVDHEGKFFQFKDVEIHPVPDPDNPVWIWYGGNSAAAVRRAVEYCDGWIASRIPMSSLEFRMKRLRRLSAESDKPLPKVGVVPYVVPADTVEAGVKRLNLEALLEDLNAHEPPPPSGRFESYEDAGGAAIAGPPDVIVEAVRRFQDAGTDHFVFDLRPCLEDWEDRLGYLGENVLPVLREGDRVAA
jgi:alkanesulfonate monooxygenase SsuD/methylene tetrahydromethanopterin reductase-like flavin-dependent oxidoreductase (luciferase family)